MKELLQCCIKSYENLIDLTNSLYCVLKKTVGLEFEQRLYHTKEQDGYHARGLRTVSMKFIQKSRVKLKNILDHIVLLNYC